MSSRQSSWKKSRNDHGNASSAQALVGINSKNWKTSRKSSIHRRTKGSGVHRIIHYKGSVVWRTRVWMRSRQRRRRTRRNQQITHIMKRDQKGEVLGKRSKPWGITQHQYFSCLKKVETCSKRDPCIGLFLSNGAMAAERSIATPSWVDFGWFGKLLFFRCLFGSTRNQ